MNARPSRYDEIAEWYIEVTETWPSEPHALLPEDLSGQRVFDMACGYGTAARYLAARGAHVTAVDLSPKMLAHATALAASDTLDIRYVHGDVTAVDWWDGDAFDGALCNMALLDIDDLDGALGTVSTVLKPGGWFSASILHPCFPGSTSESGVALSSWPPDRGYSWQGTWNTAGTGVRGHADVNHRTLATYLNAFIKAGLILDEFAEADSSMVPRYLIVRCRRAG